MTALPAIDAPFAEAGALTAPPVQQSPLAPLIRAMRGRWRWAALGAVILVPALATLGYFSGKELYQSQAILRLYPQESNILYRSGDDSVLKTFDSFAKAETSYVASLPVMARATESLLANFPEFAAGMSVADLTGSIEIRRNDSLIVLTTVSADPGFAEAKLDAVTDAYFALKIEADREMTDLRLGELVRREVELIAQQSEIRARILDVGGEYGLDALTRAHIAKVARIDSLQDRLAEIAATIAALESAAGQSGADMSDNEIMRATLLDRALADLNFERARHEAELATLLTRYPDSSQIVSDKRNEIAVIDRAMADRRQQIQVLGQTGALTDTTTGSTETSVADLRDLQGKVNEQLELARSEARELNGKQIELQALMEESAALSSLLDQTRHALDEIRVEAGRANSGFAELMSPAGLPQDAFDDSRKPRAAAGGAAGLMLAFGAILAAGLLSARVNWSDALGRATSGWGGVVVAGRKAEPARIADRLRNAIQLHPLRTAPAPRGTARIVTVARPGPGSPDDLALDLARSFARARMRTLLVDAVPGGLGPSATLGFAHAPGWLDAIVGRESTALPLLSCPGLSILPHGSHEAEEVRHSGDVALPLLRDTLARLANGNDVVVIAAGSLATDPASELLLSIADIGVANVKVDDISRQVTARLPRFDSLPQQGSVLLLTGATRGDPGLPV
jgi:polysaccharide biosynthesis transport protein